MFHFIFFARLKNFNWFFGKIKTFSYSWVEFLFFFDIITHELSIICLSSATDIQLLFYFTYIFFFWGYTCQWLRHIPVFVLRDHSGRFRVSFGVLRIKHMYWIRHMKGQFSAVLLLYLIKKKSINQFRFYRLFASNIFIYFRLFSLLWVVVHNYPLWFIFIFLFLFSS